MNTYRHVADVTTTVHDDLVTWARKHLREAGLETVEVYGQFPAQGTVKPHLVLFPYRIGPDPKLVENAPGRSLLHTSGPTSEGVQFAPPCWLNFAGSLTRALSSVFAEGHGLRETAAMDLRCVPLSDLPPALAEWYRTKEPAPEGECWVVGPPDQPLARPPALWWRPAVVLTTRYIAVAGEPGRGTTDRTSVSAPLALAALSVLATAAHVERVVPVTMPPLPYDAALDHFVSALLPILETGMAEDLSGRLSALSEPVPLDVAIFPVHDLTNHEFALLMQALQRPLQAALNLQVRLPVGAGPQFIPSSVIRPRLRPPPEVEGRRTQARVGVGREERR